MPNAECYQTSLATEQISADWDQYVLGHAEGTLFHLSQWKRVVEKSFGHKAHYLAAYEQAAGTLVGILPLFEVKSALFGHFLVSVPFAELGGGLADSPVVESLLTNQATELCRRCGASYLELKNRQPRDGLATKSLYFNFSRPILDTSEQNLLAIPRKSRAMVRKGIKAGLKAEWGHDHLDEFYRILAKNYHRLGTPIFPKRFFKTFLEEFADQANLTVIRKASGESVAAVMTFFYQDRIMPYYAGSLAEYRDTAPNDFMYWALMEYGCEHGCKTFDFGRSKAETGSFAFKKNWGFEPRPLAYQYAVVRGDALPDLSPSNPKYRKKIELWRKMPFGLTKLVGPSLAKYLA